MNEFLAFFFKIDSLKISCVYLIRNENILILICFHYTQYKQLQPLQLYSKIDFQIFWKSPITTLRVSSWWHKVRARGDEAHRTHWLMVGATIGTNPLPVCAVRDIAVAQFLAAATASAEIAQRQIEKGRRQVSWEKYATATDEAHSCDSHQSEHKSRPEVIKIWRRAFRPKARVAN